MVEYLYATSDINCFLIICLTLVAISLLALFLIKWFFPLHLRYQENAVIGCTSALVVVIYGVLAGFATLYLINNNNDANNALQAEANAAANLYRDSRLLAEPTRTAVIKDLSGYLYEVLSVEWPLMNNDKTVVSKANSYIEDITKKLSQYKSASTTDPLIITDILTLTSSLYDARHQRIEDSYISLSPEIWVAIIFGTILSLVVSYLFGVNFYLHIFIVTSAAFMATCVIFILITLDKPFVGEFTIGPSSLIHLQSDVNGELAKPST